MKGVRFNCLTSKSLFSSSQKTISPARPENLKLAGDKITAKKIMETAGVPVIPSSPGPVGTLEEAIGLCETIGYPVMVKASGGGGGRGIRICDNEKTLHEDFLIAKAEAGASFGNDELYIEKFILNPRHIEFQVLADRAPPP